MLTLRFVLPKNLSGQYSAYHTHSGKGFSMIAITGATGQLGRLVIEKLKQKMPSSGIVALARAPHKAGDIGIEIRTANYDSPSTLIAALEGVKTLLLISSSEIGNRVSQHRNVINAAKQTGVTQILYTSVLHADTSALSLADEHRLTEAELRASGLAFTILRHGWYAENYAAPILGALQGGAIYGCAGEGKISAATREDYAEAAAVVLTAKTQGSRTYELAGDTSWTLSELAAEVSRQTAKSVAYINLPEDDYAAALAARGLPEPIARAVAGYDISASQNELFDNTHQLSSLIDRPTTSLEEFVSSVLKSVTRTGSDQQV